MGRTEVGEVLRGIIERVWTNPGVFAHLDSWESIIERLNGELAAKQFVMLDFFALWGSGPELSNYKEFLRKYALSRAKQEKRTLLLIVRCLSDPPPEVVIGWGTLVDAYCSLPLDHETSQYMFARIEADLVTPRTSDMILAFTEEK